MPINRTVNTKETLDILPCPFCNGAVQVRDCGYSTFNPGSAKCEGECKREWKLGLVDDRWDAGLSWNRLQPFAKEIENLESRLLDVRRQAGLPVN